MSIHTVVFGAGGMEDIHIKVISKSGMLSDGDIWCASLTFQGSWLNTQGQTEIGTKIIEVSGDLTDDPTPGTPSLNDMRIHPPCQEDVHW